MKLLRKLMLVLAVFLAIGGTLGAEGLTIAAGAGYRALVDELSSMFAGESGIRVERIYGNMGQVTTQARTSGVVDIVIGDKRFFDDIKLPYKNEFIIGCGRLVLAASRGAGPVTLEALTSSRVQRIALPDPKLAIYGIAAAEYLKNSGLSETVSKKLIQVSTVPQVSAYLMSGEVDLGFINLTDALAIQGKIEGFVEVPRNFYTPIYIVARSLPDSPSSAAALRFGAFLEKADVKAAAGRYGL
jgi:molybdate transport system substrate-binding protein